VSAIDHLSVWAVRYALGRMTYAVSDVVDTLIDNRAELTEQSKAVIVQDIDEAAEQHGGTIGMQMDHDQWMRLRAALVEVP
jgi:hypothetical protein